MIDLTKYRAQLAALPRDPFGPVDQPLHLFPFKKDLPAPQDLDEEWDVWHHPYHWCRANVNHANGDTWTRHRDKRTGVITFGFSNATTGVLFALKFG